MCTFSFVLNEYWDQEFKKHDLSRPTCAVENTKGVKIMTTYSSFVLQVCCHVDYCSFQSTSQSSYYFDYFKYQLETNSVRSNFPEVICKG